MTFHKYLMLAGVTIFAAAGDAMLSHGMKQIGSISIQHLPRIIFSVWNPSVAIGIVLLLAFFASYMTALSWADLTYVMPATAMGYVLLALVAKFILHEHVSALRWAGIMFITGGVGFVAGGPEITKRQEPAELQKTGAPSGKGIAENQAPAAVEASSSKASPNVVKVSRRVQP
jgi:drug/metabolite transporter (DMT)-like permease